MSDQLYSRTAEQSVIGGLMLDNSRLMDVADLVHPEDFAEARHQAIYRAIVILDGKGIPFDTVTLSEQLKAAGVPEETAGLPYLAVLSKETPSAASVVHYAKLVRNYAQRRRLAAAAGKIGDLARDYDDAAKALDESQAVLSALADEGASEGPIHASVLLLEYMNVLEARMNRGGDLIGLPTGLADVDKIINGLCPGRLYVIAGKSSMGKSIFGLQAALNVAMRCNRPVLVATLEMPWTECMDRAVAAETRISLTTIQKAGMDSDEWGQISNASVRIKNSGLHIDESSTLSVGDLRARARRMHQREPLGLVMVDYLQLMTGDGENRTQEVGSISRGLKKLAKELHIPVMALAQLNRGVENRGDKRPMMSDLRESGDIEHDADLVAFLYRDEVYKPDSNDKGYAEFIIRKQRNGETGTVPLRFFGQYSRFDNVMGGLPSKEKGAGSDDVVRPMKGFR